MNINTKVSERTGAYLFFGAFILVLSVLYVLTN